MRKFIAILAIACLSGGACNTLPYANNRDIPEIVTIADGSAERAAMNARVYDASVTAVSRRFYDRTYNGLDFRFEANQHRAAAVAQSDEVGFYRELNNLLARLDDSHTRAVRPVAWRNMRIAALAESPSFGLNFAKVVNADTGETRHVVTGTSANGPGAEAGVQRGWRLETVDGEPFDEDKSYAGAERLFRFVDAQDGVHEVTLFARDISRQLGTADRREDGVLVLHFERFDDASADWFVDQIRAAHDDPPRAIVVDLRGNFGGWTDALSRILGGFFSDSERYAYFNLGPVPRVPRSTTRMGTPWLGPAAVIVSNYSWSSAEVFAAAFQERGRGPVVGMATPGQVVGSREFQLPDGGMLNIGVSELRTGGGAILEKVGVTPDHITDWSYELIVSGRDRDMEVAIAALSGEPPPAAPPSTTKIVAP